MPAKESEVLGWIERSSLNTIRNRLRKYATDGDVEKLQALVEEVSTLNMMAQRLEYMIGEDG